MITEMPNFKVGHHAKELEKPFEHLKDEYERVREAAKVKNLVNDWKQIILFIFF